MLLRDHDLDAAVAEGIVTSDQAAALREFAQKRERERSILEGHEERFRFMRGFNDFFFAIGVVLLAGGITYFVGLSKPGMAIAAALMWALAELLVGRMRLVLPGIVLAGLFVLFVFIAVPTDGVFGTSPRPPASPRGNGIINHVRMLAGGAPLAVVSKAFVAAAAAGAFYARFRFPFALLPLGASLVAAVLVAATRVVPENATALLQSLVLLACGLGVFSAAMWFDVSDRERQTRRADSAFWLHLLAAPLIVHSLIALVTDNVTAMTPAVATTIFLIIAALAVIAVIIDRRALLVSALTYLGIVIGYALTRASGALPANHASIVAATLVVLGSLIVCLGVAWMPLRRALIGRLSPALVSRLPPAPAHA
jgi:hypothetical protein